MFAVRKQSPWWLSGLSSFMSAFSAGTFVVWGGIAYKQGFVAVSILMCSGIASFLVGKFFAKKWAALDITTVGEYVFLRFGKRAVQFYTWVGMLFKIVAMGVALYSFAVVVSSLISLSPNNILEDPSTHKLSINFTIVLSGTLMLMYAVSGGLWAVLIIDAIQFVVLTITVLFVVPLSLSKIGGVTALYHALPTHFFLPFSVEFTWLFLAGWIVVHTFKLGGEWVFVQRFLAVSNPANARKSSNLFGWLYIISPIIWMLPPIIYRASHPNALPEQAYILACAEVLPAGMIGLLLAAMFSSAASYIDGEINVYAAAVTNDVYKQFIDPQASDKKTVFIGRLSSILIGLVIMVVAIYIPYFGGAERIILNVTALLAVTMVLPVLWGLYFGKIRENAIWYSTIISLAVAIVLKLGVPGTSEMGIIRVYQANFQVIDVFAGILVPLMVLFIMELSAKKTSLGFIKIQEKLGQKTEEVNTAFENHKIAIFPAKLLGFSIGALGIIMSFLIFFANEESRFLIGLFAVLLFVISLVILVTINRSSNKYEKHII